MTDTPVNGLFERVGDWFQPTEFTRGPWRADAQHGGPPSALLGHVLEPEIDPAEFLTHVEIELMRPVPLTRLRGEVRRERVSGRVARLHATLHSENEPVARANALVLRRAELDPPDWTAPVEPAIDPPDETAAVEPPRWATGQRTTYHRNGVEHRFTRGTFKEAGPAVDWIRLRQPLVADEPTSGFERVLAAADFGSGISAVYGPTATFGLINANLAVSFHRPAEGEWISLDARTYAEGGTGTGLGITMLGDRQGPVGVATQSLLGYSIR
jgi:hypothetical protein